MSIVDKNLDKLVILCFNTANCSIFQMFFFPMYQPFPPQHVVAVSHTYRDDVSDGYSILG